MLPGTALRTQDEEALHPAAVSLRNGCRGRDGWRAGDQPAAATDRMYSTDSAVGWVGMYSRPIGPS